MIYFYALILCLVVSSGVRKCTYLCLRSVRICASDLSRRRKPKRKASHQLLKSFSTVTPFCRTNPLCVCVFVWCCLSHLDCVLCVLRQVLKVRFLTATGTLCGTPWWRCRADGTCLRSVVVLKGSTTACCSQATTPSR